MGLLWAALLVLGSISLVIGVGRYVSVRRRRQQRAGYPDPKALIVEPLEEARVFRDGDGRLTIRWNQAAPSARIYAGASPDSINRSSPLAAAAHADHVVIEPLPHLPRPYFELVRDGHAPLIVAERSLPLEGVPNARDAGGYRTQDGRQVRWGCVYRTGSLAHATESDLDYLHYLGLKIVCDLRSAEELAEAPDRLPPNSRPEYRHLPINTGDQSSERMQALLFNPRRLPALMNEAYTLYMVEQNGPLYGEMLRALADPASLPLAIHCTAGKDRTGISIALLLAVLGVPDDIIVADYSLSNHFFPAFRDHVASQFKGPPAALFGLHVDDFQPLLVAHPQTMQYTLDYVRQQYGSVEVFLEQKAGIDTAVIAALKANLLD